MRVDLPYDVSNFTYEDTDFISNLAQAINRICQLLNGKITYFDNFDCKTVSFTFNAANAQQVVLHGLNRIPAGYFVIGSKAAVQVYNGANKNTTQALYVQATVATTVTLLIF